METFKVIKFNLMLDGKEIYNLEELKNNFNIMDIYESYKDGRLSKWLGFKKDGEYVICKNKIDLLSPKLTDREIIENLVMIFKIQKDDKVLDYIAKEIAEMKRLGLDYNEYSKREDYISRSIDAFLDEYNSKIKYLIKNNNSELEIKKTLLELSEDKYHRIVTLSRATIVKVLSNKAPNVIMSMLKNNKFMDIVLENIHLEDIDKFKNKYVEEITLNKSHTIKKKVIIFDIQSKVQNANITVKDDKTISSEKYVKEKIYNNLVIETNIKTDITITYLEV